MTNKPTEEIFADLRRRGMPPSDLYHMIDMRIEGYNHQPAPPKERAEEIEFYQRAEISRLKRALRDILTMHAMRWLADTWHTFDINHRKGCKGWQLGVADALRQDWHQHSGADLLDAIVEAVRAMKEASSAS